MQRKQHIDSTGALVMITFSASLGLNQALVKLVNAGFAPVFQSGLRSLCAFLPVLVYAWWMKRRLSMRDGSLAPGLLNGVLFAAEFCLLFLALDYTTVSRASLFFYVMPVWASIGAHFLIADEPLTRMKAVGLALALLGVASALAGDLGDAGDNAWLGDLMALFGGMCWAAIALVTRTTKLANCSSEMNLLYQLAVSGIFLTAISPLFGEPIRDPTWAIMGIFALQVIFIVCVGFLAWLWVLSVYPVANMASFGLLSPIFAIFFGWLIFDDTLTPTFVLAIVLAGAGIVLVNKKPRAS